MEECGRRCFPGLEPADRHFNTGRERAAEAGALWWEVSTIVSQDRRLFHHTCGRDHLARQGKKEAMNEMGLDSA